MCGIAGFWSNIGRTLESSISLANQMARDMKNRGPDFQGVWNDPRCELFLAHSRLSVLDLTNFGNQPMKSDNGNCAIAYNGEVYNYKEIRTRLIDEGAVFKTNTDTEVVLKACELWGVKNAVEYFIGMFAFAFWDGNKRELYLVRDPLGIKPLYYTRAGREFIFSSTLLPIIRFPSNDYKISNSALNLYLKNCYVPAPYSILGNVFKLKPGHVLTVNELGASEDQYWSLLNASKARLTISDDKSSDSILNQFEKVIRESVRNCLISDVPVGAFLSGGIDSSLISTLMQVESSSRIKTFTVGFEDKRYDESQYARDIAKYIGSDHTEIFCSPYDAQELIPELTEAFDEPFADSSQLPTLLLSKLARSQVTVALSGDGGDELFAGYDRYYWMDKLECFNQLSDRSFKRYVKNFLGNNNLISFLQNLNAPKKIIHHADGMRHLVRMANNYSDRAFLYHNTPMSVSTYQDFPLVIQQCDTATLVDDRSIQKNFHSIVDWMQYVDQSTYLPDDILQKVDRCSMRYSLEARVPLLNTNVVEFSWAVPKSMKISNGTGKIIMRKLLSRYMPESLFDRPKRGFSIPIANWLRSDLRDWAESLIDSVEDRTMLDRDRARTAWKNFLTGRADHTQSLIWAMLVYLQWFNNIYVKNLK